MQEKFNYERDAGSEEFSRQDEMNLGDSIRNQPEVGATFGEESSTARFSNVGQKNKARKAEGDTDIDDVNDADRNSGNGGTMYSDYLNKSENEFIIGTGQFSNDNRNAENNRNTTKPLDAMQCNRKNDESGQ
jgi:hypothetical protein